MESGAKIEVAAEGAVKVLKRRHPVTLLSDEVKTFSSIKNRIVQSKKPMKIRFNFKGNERIVDFFQLSEEDLDYMATHFEDSYFALDNQKTFDTNVRKSKSTQKFDCMFDTDHLNEFFFYERMRVEAYKINLYEPGSFFEFHTNTKVDDSHCGTLILVPFTEHEGGGLDFGHTTLDLKPPPNRLGSIYFPLYVEHKVNSLKSGRRVSIVFQVFMEEIIPLEMNPFSEEPNDDQHMVKDPSILVEKLFDYYKGRTNILLPTDSYNEEFTAALLRRFGGKSAKVSYDMDAEFAYATNSLSFLADSDNSCQFDFGRIVESQYNDNSIKYEIEETFLDSDRAGGSWKSRECTRRNGNIGDSPCSSTYSFGYYEGLLLNPKAFVEPKTDTIDNE